jgi:flagellin
MADTFRLDFVGTKAGIKGASVVMGYLETGMRVLDSASALLSRLQELAVLGANDTNTNADHEAINFEAEAIADEFHRLMSTSTYKGKPIFVESANSEFVSMGGRDSQMQFGIGTISYTELYNSAEPRIIESGTGVNAGPNDQDSFDLQHLPSDAVAGFEIGTSQDPFEAGETYRLVDTSNMSDDDKTVLFGITEDLEDIDDVVDGAEFTIDADYVADDENVMESAGGGGIIQRVSQTDVMTKDIEAVQAKINTARVQAGSQYAALESAVNYTTDLTAQYELGYNTVNDVNFSMETAHLAKNQILQQAATAMLAQANQGQQGLLQLIS